MIRNRFSVVIFSVLLPVVALTADIYDFVPRQSDQVIQIDLTDIPGMESVKKDLTDTFSRQTGIDGKSDKYVAISKDIAKILIVTLNLTEDETFVIVGLRVPENDFCRDLEKLTGVQHAVVKRASRIERQFVLQKGNSILGIPFKKRTFVYSFPAVGVAVFAKNTLDRYFAGKPWGLPKADRTPFQYPTALVSGFTRMNPQLLQDNPLLPPFYRTVYSLSAGQAGSIRFQGEFSCTDAESAEMVKQQLRQYVNIGGFLLNQYDPELMREWMQQVKINSSSTAVTVNGELSRAFLERLAAASEQMSAAVRTGRKPPRNKSQGK